MAEATSIERVLIKTREMLAIAQRGFAEMKGIQEPAARSAGIYAVATFGRSTTLVLQNIRSLERDRFNAWYAPWVEQMDGDALFRFFNDLRNEVLKQVPPDPNRYVTISAIDGATVRRYMENAPPGTTSFVVVDGLGGSGYQIGMPDGSTMMYYVNLPDEWGVEVSWHLPNPPTEFAGHPLADTSIENLAGLYLGFLGELVADAEAHFAT